MESYQAIPVQSSANPDQGKVSMADEGNRIGNSRSHALVSERSLFGHLRLACQDIHLSWS